MKNALKYLEILCVALQAAGVCANKPKAQKHVSDTVSRYNERYNELLNANRKSGVLASFNRFLSELTDKVGSAQVGSVLAGFTGTFLFTQWQNEQRDAIVERVLTECCSELRQQCGNLDLTDEQLKEAIVAVKESENPMANLASLLGGGSGGLPPELAQLLGR